MPDTIRTTMFAFAGLVAVAAIVERDMLPELPSEVIGGIIRRGGKLLVAGASKSGKSYLMIELAVAVATGSEWLGFQCARGRVLYVNLEIQMPQFMHRVQRVCEKMGVDTAGVPHNLMIANQRGKVSDITPLVDRMLAACRPGEYDLVIIDPAYKVQPGSENDADAITAFARSSTALPRGWDAPSPTRATIARGLRVARALPTAQAGRGCSPAMPMLSST